MIGKKWKRIGEMPRVTVIGKKWNSLLLLSVSVSVSEMTLPKQNNKKSLYEILELTFSKDSITLRDIKKQYHKLSLKYHPDKNNGDSEELFKEINYAYSILSDEQKREKYDATGEIGGEIEGKSSFLDFI